MDIDERAQQILLKLMETDKTGYDAEGISIYAYEIADAMQAESDKRKPKGLPEVLFEPDWSQAPESAKFWAMDHNRMAHWFNLEPCLDKCDEWVLGNNWEGTNNRYSAALSFNYQGDWKDSLRKRP